MTDYLYIMNHMEKTNKMKKVVNLMILLPKSSICHHRNFLTNITDTMIRVRQN